jgi:hypothetical protein
MLIPVTEFDQGIPDQGLLLIESSEHLLVVLLDFPRHRWNCYPDTWAANISHSNRSMRVSFVHDCVPLQPHCPIKSMTTDVGGSHKTFEVVYPYTKEVVAQGVSLCPQKTNILLTSTLLPSPRSQHRGRGGCRYRCQHSHPRLARPGHRQARRIPAQTISAHLEIKRRADEARDTLHWPTDFTVC